jgi:hypothetical protein
MVWYNPFTWGKKEGETVLYCMNPQCYGKIEGERCAYEPATGEIYHPGECQGFAIAHRTWKQAAGRSLEDTVQVEGFEFITRKRAEELIRNGAVKQPTRLERLTS